MPHGTNQGDGQSTWPPGYEYQTSQFDGAATQTWNQPSQAMYTSIAPSLDAGVANYYPNDAHQAGNILDDPVNGTSTVSQGGLAGQAALSQYQGGQGPYNPTFEPPQQDIYAQHGKLGLEQAIGDPNEGQSHQAQPPPQSFPPQQYTPYHPTHEQAFHHGGTPLGQPRFSPTQQTAAYQQKPQPQPRQPQQPQQPQQQQAFQHSQPFSQTSQVSTVPHQQVFPQQGDPGYTSAAIPQVGQYDTTPRHGHHPIQQQAQFQSQAYMPQQAAPASHYQGPGVLQGSGAHHDIVANAQQAIAGPAQALSGPALTTQAPAIQGTKRDVDQVGTPHSNPDSSGFSTPTAEPAQKKRKQTVKKPLETPVAATPGPQSSTVTRTFEEGDALPPPTSTSEELAAIGSFKKRPNASKAKFPAILGAPRLVSTGIAKLPGM
jgi:hypothetical protein